ncbi:DDE-type integrase/transposase/recombinase [Bacillus cereus]|nr:DDE-type integrase/transposase/recombinase [Bacillus thuringiensis]MEB9534627.1 DDE-type integrase/transposase/recombinase [Bacillus cereus]MEB9727828.1 DDE-type integrase/transposase/recombinase [Bacillus cereus]MEC2942005.1 DDE-type integrase/transposase/recombinase [Bacillus cereus]MEC3177779.1 DDE-type integrase/transposase/recombinase [Bacillus cereus]
MYRIIDLRGNIIEFLLRKTRNHKTANCFSNKYLRSFHVSNPRIITGDKKPANPLYA